MLTPHDIDLIERDARLTRLPSLLDAEQYQPMILARAPEADAAHVRLTYLRYKPGMNCVAGYEYEAGGKTRFAYAKAYTDAQRDKRDKAGERAGDAGDDPVVVTFFPIDNKLRSLKKLDGDALERQFIQRVFSRREDLWAGGIEPIRYKPERRFVASLTLDGQNEAVVKMHAGNSYARLRNNSKAFSSRDNLLLAKRIGHSDRHRVLAFEWLPGRLLSDDLRAGRLEPGILDPVGQALAHIHAQRTDDLPTHSLEMHAGHLDAVARQIAFLCPDLAVEAERTARQIGALLMASPTSFTATHGDFYAKQILVHDDLIGVLDFDESAYTDPMSDIGNFFAHLERDRLRFGLSVEAVETYQDALLSGYARGGGAYDKRQVALFFASSLFKLLPHPFRFREPDWPEQTGKLLARVRKALGKALTTVIDTGSEQAAPLTTPVAPAHVPDEAMPYLARALEPTAALPALRKVLEPLAPGSTIESLTSVVLQRHKPGRRALIEYTAVLRNAGGDASEYTVLGKTRAKGLDTSTYELTRTLWNGPFNASSKDGLFVPEPLGVAPAFNMWVQKKVNGLTATHFLDQPISPLLARDVARALHKLNTFGPPPKRAHTVYDELAILEKRLDQAALERPDWSVRLGRVFAACRKAAGQLPYIAAQPIHRDFYPDNLLIADRGVYLLDLDLYSLGDPALDAGNFIAHVIESGLRRYKDPCVFNTCIDAFEDTYVALAGSHIRHSIQVYTTLSLARHIHISMLFPERRAFSEALLALCEQRLTSTGSRTKTSITIAL